MTERSFGWRRPADARLWMFEKEYEEVKKPYPQVADLRNWDSPVGDQGQEGSCVDWMLKAMMENLMNHLKLPFIPLSAQYPYYWVRKIEGTWPQDAGSTILDAVKVGSKYGFCPESDWPYSDKAYKKIPPLKAQIDAKNHMISAFYSVKQTLASLCTCIGADQMPVGNGVSVYDNWPMDTTTGLIPMPQGQEQGGHGIPLVGYNLNKGEATSPTMPGEKIPGYCFIFKNSWSKDWGHKGYGFLPIDYVLNLDLASEQVEILRETDKP